MIKKGKYTVYRLSDLENIYAILEDKEYRRKERLQEKHAVDVKVPMEQLVS